MKFSLENLKGLSFLHSNWAEKYIPAARIWLFSFPGGEMSSDMICIFVLYLIVIFLINTED